MNNLLQYLLLSLFAMTLFSCSNHTTINFVIDEDIDIKNKNGSISVYGYDENIADVSANTIHVQKFTIDQLPVSITLEIPNDPTSKIAPLSNPQNAKFYLGLDWDSNGDGQKDIGDISFDYDKKKPTISLGTNNEIPLRVRTE